MQPKQNGAAQGEAVLAIDVGGGTQDILLYEPGKPIENCVKLILPSQTVIVADRIAEARAAGHDVHLTGSLMGGGPCVGSIKRHLKAGLRVTASEFAARTVRDSPDQVRDMGIEITDRPPAHAIVVEMRDVDLHALGRALAEFDVELPGSYAVAVQDHGQCLEGSNRVFRFRLWREFVEGGGALEDLVYTDVSDVLTRMKAVKDDVPGALLMDTGAAAVWGALCDETVREARGAGVIVVNCGNQHVIACLLKGDRVWGLYEHHTTIMDTDKLGDYTERLRAGTLTNEEVFADNGHGCYIDPGYERGNGFGLIAVTGPQRALARGLGYYPANPFGDMMLMGCFGLVAAKLGRFDI